MGATEGFYSYQGTQLKTATGGNINASVDASGRAIVSYRLFVDAAWATDGLQQASGIWPVIATTDAANAFFWPIAEYIDKGRATELGIGGVGENGAFRFWDSNGSGSWAHYTNVSSAGWVDLKYTAAKAASQLTET